MARTCETFRLSQYMRVYDDEHRSPVTLVVLVQGIECNQFTQISLVEKVLVEKVLVAVVFITPMF